MDSFGKRLRAEREKQGLTQGALAKKAYTRMDFITQIENGVRNPSLKTLTNILRALDVSADSLIYGVATDDEMDGVLNEFASFLARKPKEDVTTYYEMIRLMSKHVESVRASGDS